MTSGTVDLAQIIREFNKRKTPSKMRNVKTVVDGITFDSLIESRRYVELKYAQMAGEIEDLETHITFGLVVNGKLVCEIVPDFRYRRLLPDRTRLLVVEDVKGRRAGAAWKEFRIKAKLFEALYGFQIEVYPPKQRIPRKPRKKKA